MSGEEIRRQLQKHHAAAFGWALGCCAQDAGEAEEVLQTVYLKILQGRAHYGGKATFKTWLFAVIRKTAADARRRQMVRDFRLSTFRQHLADNAVVKSPDERVDAADQQLALRRLLAKLPARQREVLHLVFYHDLTLQQAAGVMDVSVGAARKHYDRGKKRMRLLLEECEMAAD